MKHFILFKKTKFQELFLTNIFFSINIISIHEREILLCYYQNYSPNDKDISR